MDGSRRVLLVEDLDAPTGRHLEAAGFDVVRATDVEAAVAALDDPLDCAVTGLDVPDDEGLRYLGGIEVLRAVRERAPELPVLLFSEVGNDELAREALAAGVTDYVRRDGEGSYERLVERVQDVVERRQAVSRAERQARINEVIRDINQALVRSDSRTEIEQSVAEELAAAEQYVLAWIAEVDDHDAVSLRAMGVEGAAIEGGGAIDLSDTTAYTEPVRRAASERAPVVVDDPEVGAWEAALDRPPAAVAAIPFVYEDSVYGVLVVYSGRADAFDAEERRVLAEVGENVAYAMNAVDVRRRFKLRELQLRRQNERLEEFAEVVSHDLRNPLTVARGSVDLLEDDGEHVGRIDRALSRMEAIVDDVLTLARQGRSVGETKPVDLRAVADDAWGTVDTGGATLSTGDRVVEADRSRLVQLLENLFRNAIEHGDPDEVRVGESDGGFYVADDGRGLPAERDDLFEHGVTTADDGTGFGLAIVRSIAEAHGWTVTAADGDEGGARFEFGGVEVAGDVATPPPVFGGERDGDDDAAAGDGGQRDGDDDAAAGDGGESGAGADGGA
jgi:two-component system OmpR family sensor kinase